MNKPIYWLKYSELIKHKNEGGINLRDIKFLNTTLLFKQAWRMYKNPENLVSRVMITKYAQSAIMVGKNEIIPKRISYAIRSILEASRKYSEIKLDQIGSGSRVKLGGQSWAQNWKEYTQLKTKPYKEGLLLKLVNTLFKTSKEWDIKRKYADRLLEIMLLQYYLHMYL